MVRRVYCSYGRYGSSSQQSVAAHNCVTPVQEIRCPLLAAKDNKHTHCIDLVHENNHSSIHITMKMNKALNNIKSKLRIFVVVKCT